MLGVVSYPKHLYIFKEGQLMIKLFLYSLEVGKNVIYSQGRIGWIEEEQLRKGFVPFSKGGSLISSEVRHLNDTSPKLDLDDLFWVGEGEVNKWGIYYNYKFEGVVYDTQIVRCRSELVRFGW